MKFKHLDIEATSLRQITMTVSSEKETVLYSEQFESESNKNAEFVVGLPIAVKNMERFTIKLLAKRIKTCFEEETGITHNAIAIHSKDNEEEVHYHISYCGEVTDTRDLKEKLISII